MPISYIVILVTPFGKDMGEIANTMNNLNIGLRLYKNFEKALKYFTAIKDWMKLNLQNANVIIDDQFRFVMQETNGDIWRVEYIPMIESD